MYADTGDYVVKFYDKYNEPLFGQVFFADSLQEARQVANQHFNGDAACYCIFRCIYNSTDIKNRWNV